MPDCLWQRFLSFLTQELINEGRISETVAFVSRDVDIGCSDLRMVFSGFGNHGVLTVFAALARDRWHNRRIAIEQPFSLISLAYNSSEVLGASDVKVGWVLTSSRVSSGVAASARTSPPAASLFLQERFKQTSVPLPFKERRGFSNPAKLQFLNWTGFNRSRATLNRAFQSSAPTPSPCPLYVNLW